MKDRRWYRVVLFFTLVLCVHVAAPFRTVHAANVDDLAARPPAIKPQHTVVDQTQNRDRVAVKFKDGLNIRVRNGVLTDFATGVLNVAQPTLNALRGGQWLPTHAAAEATLDHWRQTAQANLHKQIADPNLQFQLRLPHGVDASTAIDALNALDCVEIALPVPMPVPAAGAPLPPDFQPAQGYLKFAPGGIDAIGAWGTLGESGSGVKIADIEYSWNLNHQDLPMVTMLGPAAVDPFNDNNHGTAVLGELAAVSNNWGVTGIAYSSQIYIVAANTAAGYSVANAITTAMSALGPGDVLLIEQQMVGPHGGQRYVPVEWYQPTYNAIVLAVGNGITVVEAAGNGGEDLDSQAFSTGNGGHWPFLPQNDSGALIVGAGAAYQIGSDTDRSRLSFSTFGSTVDLQGWGEQVVTTGYGTFYAADGVNLYFTSTFNGTSSASPIVAGAAALLQSRKKSFSVVPFTPNEVKSWLVQTGSPQQSGTFPATQNIGPRPNVTQAMVAAGLTITNDDCTHAPLKLAGTFAFSNAGAGTDGPEEPASCADGGFTQIDHDVWFRFLSQCDGIATVSLCGVNFDSKVAVYGDVCPSAAGQELACNDDFCGSASQVSWPVISGSVYRIRVGGKNGAMGGGFMTISCAPATMCAADINGDSQVNVADLLSVIASWGGCPAPPAPCVADVNHDSQVNVADMLAVIGSWGPCP